MKRKAIEDLKKWRDDPERKPMVCAVPDRSEKPG